MDAFLTRQLCYSLKFAHLYEDYLEVLNLSLTQSQLGIYLYQVDVSRITSRSNMNSSFCLMGYIQVIIAIFASIISRVVGLLS